MILNDTLLPPISLFALTNRAVYDKLMGCVFNLLEILLICFKKIDFHQMRTNQLSNIPFLSALQGLKKKSRIVQKGLEYVPLFIKDVVLIYTENKLTFVLDRGGRKYVSDKNLADLIVQLDRERFFRANRQYIVNMEFIRSYRSYGKSKLQVEVALSDNKHSIIISQENAPHFLEWISEA